tara:strand:- start:42 stop:218 length:177 start_codon:yes stop_codon:yes gene_type:complete
MTNDSKINFPKNPYDGQIFYYEPDKDIYEYAIPPEHLREQLGEPRWIIITSQDFSGGS